MVDLVIRQRVSTSDPATASTALAEILGAAELHAAGAFAYEQRSLVDDGITVSRIASRGEGIELQIAGCADLVVVAVRTGRLEVTCRATVIGRGPQDLLVLPFAEAAAARWTDAAFDLYSFPLSSFVRTLGAPDTITTIRVPYLTSRSEELTALWHRLAELVTRQVLDRPEVYSRDVVRSQLTDGLTAVTVEAFGLTNLEEDERLRDEEVVRRAEAFMRDRLASPITVPEIAAAALVSVRGLQLVFQRVHASTPVAHLRRTRLRAARTELLHPGTQTTVGEVGRRVGYSNLGRFSAHYRDEFDEIPSRTLERSRVRR